MEFILLDMGTDYFSATSRHNVNVKIFLMFSESLLIYYAERIIMYLMGKQIPLLVWKP